MSAEMNGGLILALLTAWLLHELGHWLALRSLGMAGRLHNRWFLGVALEVPPACRGWRESYVAVAGPLANLLLAVFAWRWDYSSLLAANFVLGGGKFTAVFAFRRRQGFAWSGWQCF